MHKGSGCAPALGQLHLWHTLTHRNLTSVRTDYDTTPILQTECRFPEEKPGTALPPQDANIHRSSSHLYQLFPWNLHTQVSG